MPHQITPAGDVILPGQSLTETLKAMNKTLTEGFSGVNTRLDGMDTRVTKLEAINHDEEVAARAVAAHKATFFGRISAKWKALVALASLASGVALAIAAFIVH